MSIANATPVRARSRDRLDTMAVSVLVLLCALWGLQQAAVKTAVAQGLPPILQAGLRSTVAAALLLLWVALREGQAAARDLLRIDRAFLPGLLVALLFAVEFMFLYAGLDLTTASRGVVFLYTAPFFTALGTHLFVPAERMSMRQFAGLVIAFGGVAITFADGLLGGGGSLLGDTFCAVAAACWGATIVLIRASPVLMRTRATKLLFVQLAGSAPLLLIAAAVSGQLSAWPQATALAWTALFYQTAVVAFASYLTWFWLILVYPVNRLAGFTFLTPFFGILAGALLLGEPVGAAILIGLVAIAVGLRLLNPPPRTR